MKATLESLREERLSPWNSPERWMMAPGLLGMNWERFEVSKVQALKHPAYSSKLGYPSGLRPTAKRRVLSPWVHQGLDSESWAQRPLFQEEHTWC